MSGLTRLFPLKILPSNPTRKKPSFITLFPSFCIYLLCSSSVSISKNCVSELHQLKSPPFTIQNIKNSLQFQAFQNLSFSITSYKNTTSSQRLKLISRHKLLKKNLFSSIHSQKCIHLPTILPLLFILARKIRGGEEKRRRKLRESSVPGRNPLSNHERRRDKLISIQSVVSTDVRTDPRNGP